MKYKYYCCVEGDSFVIDFLQKRDVKYKTNANTFFITVFSDTEGVEDFLTHIQGRERNNIFKYAIYSKEEIESANWFMLDVHRMAIDTINTRFTFEAKCLYHKSTMRGDPDRYYHLNQINPYVSKRTPKWTNRFNFCTDETGSTTKIFCSDLAKEAIIKNNIVGVDFMPVLKGDLKTEAPDISQLVFKHKLPLEAYNLIGEYKESVCPFCGRINYVFTDPNADLIRLNLEKLPEGIDAFGSELTFYSGFGEEPVVVSKRFYDLIIKELNENPRHMSFLPVG